MNKNNTDGGPRLITRGHGWGMNGDDDDDDDDGYEDEYGDHDSHDICSKDDNVVSGSLGKLTRCYLFGQEI